MVSRRLDYRIAGLLTSLLVTGVGATAQAAVPSTMTQQGLLLDANNQPVTGSQKFTFTIYDALTAGNVLWTETQTITLDGGYFSTQLGSVTAIPTAVFNGSTRYLGIQIGTDAEMTPREAMTSVPYAMVSRDATGDINPTSVTINGTQVIDANGHWVGPTTGLAGTVGPTGPTGAAGAAGPAGAAGAAGPAGAAGAAGAKGATGATGAAGAPGASVTGPTGPAGAAGPTGPAGAVGPTGPTGAAGTAGATGPTGAAGTSGVVATYSANGPSVAPPSDGVGTTASSVGFISKTVSVTIATGQKIFAAGSAELATYGQYGDPSLQVRICYQGTGAITLFPDEPALGTSFGTFIGPNQTEMMMEFSRQAIATGLPAGSYSVGVCATNTPGGSGGNWSTTTSGINGDTFTGVSKIVAMVTQ